MAEVTFLEFSSPEISSQNIRPSQNSFLEFSSLEFSSPGKLVYFLVNFNVFLIIKNQESTRVILSSGIATMSSSTIAKHPKLLLKMSHSYYMIQAMVTTTELSFFQIPNFFQFSKNLATGMLTEHLTVWSYGRYTKMVYLHPENFIV